MQVKGIIESVLGIARRECKRLLENRIYMFCMVVFPIAVTLFFTSLMGEGQPEKMPIGIVDLDNSTTTRRLTRMLDSFQSTEVVKHYANFEEARSAMQRNEIYGFVLYPKGTTAQLLASRQPKISFYYSYASLTAGALVFRDMKTAATLGSAAVGKSVMTAKGCTQEQIMAYLQPIVIDLHMISNPWVNYNIYLSTMLVPGCLLLFIFLITAYSFGTELKENTSRELMQRAQGNALLAVTGKLLPQTLIFLAVMFTYMYYLFGVLDFPHPGGIWPIIILGIIGVLASQGLALFFFAMMPSLRMSMSICSLWGVLSFSLAGSAFPVMAMDGELQIISFLFPLRHFFTIYQASVFNGFPLYDVAINLAALAAFALLPLVVLPRLGKALNEYVYLQ